MKYVVLILLFFSRGAGGGRGGPRKDRDRRRRSRTPPGRRVRGYSVDTLMSLRLIIYLLCTAPFFNVFDYIFYGVFRMQIKEELWKRLLSKGEVLVATIIFDTLFCCAFSFFLALSCPALSSRLLSSPPPPPFSQSFFLSCRDILQRALSEGKSIRAL